MIENLLISHIEIRSEDCLDIRKYVHERKIEKIVVPLSSGLKQTRATFLEVLVFISSSHQKQAVVNVNVRTCFCMKLHFPVLYSSIQSIRKSSNVTIK